MRLVGAPPAWKKAILKLMEESQRRNAMWSHLQQATLANRRDAYQPGRGWRSTGGGGLPTQ